MPDSAPLVFIVDDDVSVRESLEFLIRQQRWQPEVFASADEFIRVADLLLAAPATGHLILG